MRLVVDNRIRLEKADLPNGSLTVIKKAFRYNNPDYFRKRNMGYYIGNIPRVIGTYKIDTGGGRITVPRGGLEKLRDILAQYGEDCEIVDRRHESTPVEFEFDPGFVLRPYQEQAVSKILEAETCLIEAAPAAGKTEILCCAIARAGGRAGVLVHDRNLFDQWIKRIQLRLGIPSREIGRVGGGKFKLGSRITVLMQQSARNHIDKLTECFDFLAADEVHHYAANTFLLVVDRIKARYRVGASATVKRQDLKHFLIHDLFGDIVFSIDRQELVDLGYTTEIELNIVHTDFNYDYRNEIALRDYFETSFTDYEDLTAREKRDAVNELGMEPKEFPQYLDAIATDPDRNNLIYTWIRKEYDKGSTCIIFTKRREHCKIWAENLKKIGLECVVFWGANGKAMEIKRIEKDLKRLKSKKVRIAIGTVVDEGIDMPAVDAGFITYRNASNPGQLEQQAGRIARLFEGKEVGKLYYFCDTNIDAFKHDERILSNRFKKVVIHDKTRKRKKICQKG